ncbi:MAG: AAA domain-containing protein [Natronomonas sp.]
MNVRGHVLEAYDSRTVETNHGTSELAEVLLRIEDATDPVRITLWGRWSQTTAVLEPGMELLVTDVETSEFRGESQHATSGSSVVVVEPEFLVDVTALRAWVQCPRIYYLEKLTGVPLKYPVTKGTVVHDVFGDLLRGRELDTSIDERVADAAVELALLDREVEPVIREVRQNAAAIEGWLEQETFGEDTWRSELTLISEEFGLKGRADAVRNGMPVELKTGKNLGREPRFQDKIQAASYALLLGDSVTDAPDTGTLLYTKNSAIDRGEASGDLSPAKEFSIGPGLLRFILRNRNQIAAAEFDSSVPTGHEADAKCEYCFERDACMAVAGRLDQESKAGTIGQPLPAADRAYFDRMYRAIESERRSVHREYRKLWEQTKTERADDDRALVDLQPIEAESIDGGRWRLVADRPGDAVSKIREGDLVLASDGHPIRGKSELGRVEELDERVVVTTDEPIDLHRIDVYPSEIGVDRLLSALHDGILQADPDRRDVLFGRRSPKFRSAGEQSHSTGSNGGRVHKSRFVENNDAQDQAIRRALASEDFALVHGPPGTGKTYTLARIVRALVERGDRVLVSAFTNRAVDNAIEALESSGVSDIVRWGSQTGVREDVQQYRLESIEDPHERAARLRDASVVAATAAGCGSRIMNEQQFDVAVVDEAGQLTEPGTFLPITLSDRFVLVGDHQQLPPVVRSGSTDGSTGADSGESGDSPLQQSLFERLVEEHPDASVLLDRQYRMNQRIQYFSSQEFYDGLLRPADGRVAGQRLDDLDGVRAADLPNELRDSVCFIDPDGVATGNVNTIEAECVQRIVDDFLGAGVNPGTIGVIAPFRAQVAEISSHVSTVTVDTVDRFQGSSKEVIVISFVATGELSSPIFDDYRRVNVALTRAKKSLVLVGDEEALRSVPFYERMLEWAQAG